MRWWIQTYLIARKDQSLNVYGRHQTICQKRKRIGNSCTGSETIQLRHRDRMSYANNEKREMTNDGRNRTSKSRKNKNSQRKGNLQILGNIGIGHQQTS